MHRYFIVAAGFFALAPPCMARTNCFTEQEVIQLAKSNGLRRYGTMELGPKISDHAYINSKTKKFLSVKQNGKCFFEPTFLTERQYEERYQFEGDGEGE
ncbi:hypothetical protein J2X76_004778 [Neorhizobium sp. 2083]|uniref:hypothetical protein n=1 Tax=Neorhizobium sp. 2083 TaxID=2817762 RepID=UPI00285F303D|nr:hypothetical protein [Neorhizobium sp. 2083]MDR6819586.1 hypothetical protein [Neorhizobium sp. 2083]